MPNPKVRTLTIGGVTYDLQDNISGYITGITSSDVTTALGFTPYNGATNPNGYTSNTGTITSVKTTAGAHTTINVSSGAANFNVPTKTSHLTNDSGFLTSYTETDPTVPSWAKESSKPSYNFSEIGNTPTTISGYGITNAYTKTEVDGLVSGVLHYKGTKANSAALPSSGNTTGDVWHLTDTGAEWAWDGSVWQELGTAVDLSNYVTTDDSRLSDARTPTAHNQALSTITDADDLKAIEALSGTSGLLKKTAANTWTLDTNTYLTSFMETDPVFSASAAAGITSTDISNWNAKVSDTGQWNGVTLSTSTTSSSSSYYIPSLSSTSGTTAYLYTATNNPTNNAIAKYDGSSYLKSTTPSANDNSTKVATTAYVDGAINTLEKIFIVTMTYTNDTYSFDKTYSEIMSAYNAGKHIVGHDTSWQRYWYISTIDSVNAIIKFQLIPDGYTSSSGANIYFDEVSINSSNQITSTNRTITVPIKTSQLTNDSGFTAKSTTTATLTTTWSSKTQTVSVTGVTASNTVVVTPAPASYNAYCEYGVYCSAQASGTLTFICDEVPTSSLTVNVLILN